MLHMLQLHCEGHTDTQESSPHHTKPLSPLPVILGHTTIHPNTYYLPEPKPDAENKTAPGEINLNSFLPVVEKEDS